MVPLGFDPEGVQFKFPAVIPTQASAPISSILFEFNADSSPSAFGNCQDRKGICFFELLCLEIACEEIPGPGSYKDKLQIVEGPQCIIYQLHGSKFEQTPGPDDYEDVKDKKEGITIVQFEYYLIVYFIEK